MYTPTIAKVYATSTLYVRWYELIKKEHGKMPKKELGMLMRSWAGELLNHVNIDIDITGQPEHEEKVIFVGNHVSYVDIPVLLSQVPVSFVAKAELLKWPVLNEAFKRAQIIFVKRESESSRRSTLNAISKAMNEGMFSVAIFPSGTTDIKEKKPWRRGAFNIAQTLGVKIQPFRISYTPLRKVAYIDKDFFPYHLWQLLSTNEIQAQIEFHEPVSVTDVESDVKKWQKWSQGLLNS